MAWNWNWNRPGKGISRSPKERWNFLKRGKRSESAAGVKKLKELGFERYEVSNFAKKGRESRHNMNYWQRGEYIGFGVAASSCINNIRFTNTFDLDEYFKCILSNHLAVIDREEVDKEGQKEEFIMLALRTSKGLNLQEYTRLFASDFKQEFAPAISKMQEYIEFSENYFRIKPEYLFVQNTIIIEFLNQ